MDSLNSMRCIDREANVFAPGRAGVQTNGSAENGLQALNVGVGEICQYDDTVSRRLCSLAVKGVVSACAGRYHLVALICLGALKQDDNTM